MNDVSNVNMKEGIERNLMVRKGEGERKMPGKKVYRLSTGKRRKVSHLSQEPHKVSWGRIASGVSVWAGAFGF